MPNLLGSYANRAPGWKCGKAVTGTVSVADTISHTRYVPSSLRYRCYQLNDDCLFISAKNKENIDEFREVLYKKVRELHVQKYRDLLPDRWKKQ